MADPKVYEVRQALDGVNQAPSYTIGIGLFVLHALLYLLLFGLTLSSASIWAKLLSALATGSAIGSLFMLGHDAGHNALTPSRRLNDVLGRLSLLPGLHLLSSWDLEHNRLHHCWTNLRGKDCIYMPLSPADWQRLSSVRRVCWRFFHTVPGIAFYYLVTVWWQQVVALRQESRALLRSQREYRQDRWLAIAFVATQTLCVLTWGTWSRMSGHSTGVVLAEWLLSVALPFLVWNWLIAFVTLQHHTHPKVRWFADEREWSFYQAQVCCSLHLDLPPMLDHAFQHIFDHTAHHVQKAIPSYRAAAAQQALQSRFGADVVLQPASWAHLCRILKVCRLYDFERHIWLDFDGRPSTPEHLPGPLPATLATGDERLRA